MDERGCCCAVGKGKRRRIGRGEVFPRCCGDDIVVVVVWAAPLWWWRSCRLGGSRQYAPNPTTTTFLHMHLAKKLFSLSLILFFCLLPPPPPSRHIGWAPALRYYYLFLSSRIETGHLLCLCVCYTAGFCRQRNLLTITRPFFYILYICYIDEMRVVFVFFSLRRETCPLSRIEFRLFRRSNSYLLPTLFLSFFLVFFF